MKSTPAILFVLILLGQIIVAQSPFQNQWEEIEKLELSNKINEAHKILNGIYEKAQKDQLNDEMIKVTVFKSKYTLINQEDAQRKVLKMLDSLITIKQFPARNIYQSYKAQLLFNYYNTNRYLIDRRNKQNGAIDDFKQWTKIQFVDEINALFTSSLEEPLELAKIKTVEYDALFFQRVNGRFLQPTLLDVLFREAFPFFNDPIKKSYYSPIKPTEKEMFLPTQEISANATLLKVYPVLKMYNLLEKLHSRLGNDQAYLYTVIERMKYERSLSNDEFTLLYIDALEKFYRANKGNKEASLVLNLLAREYYQLSLDYSLPDFKSYRNKSIQLAQLAIDDYKDSYGSLLAQVILSSIFETTARIDIDNYVTPNDSILGNLTYRNIDNATLYVIPGKSYYLYKNDSLARDTFNKALANNELIHAEHFPLHDVEDTYSHDYQFVVPGLNAGHYNAVLEVCENDVSKIKFLSFNVSNIAAIERKTPTYIELSLYNRKTGAPLRSARVQRFNNYTFNPIGNFKVDQDGRVKLPLKKNEDANDFDLLIINGKDTLETDLYGYREVKTKYKHERIAKSFLYLDRGIYRPNQEVFFKGIVLENYKKQSKTLDNFTVKLEVKDANYQVIHEDTLTTNDYGSVSGSFKLPQDVLTGRFTLSLNKINDRIRNVDRWINNQYSFQVEEYKLPKFKTSFEPIKELYKINDSVKVVGKAMALLGSPITNAQVKYTVKRKAQYHWYYRYKNKEESFQTGTVKTKKDGSYEIVFKALPDENYKKGEKVSYIYEVNAAVTDLNGETREANTQVKVSTEPFSLSISKNDLTIDNDTITIAARNANGQFASTKVVLEIRKKEDENRPIFQKRTESNYYSHRSYIVNEKSENTEAFPKFYEYSREDHINAFPYRAAYNREFVSSSNRYESRPANDWKDMPILYKKEVVIDSITSVKVPINEEWQNGAYYFFVKSIEEDVSNRQEVNIHADKSQPLFPTILEVDVSQNNDLTSVTAKTSMNGIYTRVLIWDKKSILKDEVLYFNKGTNSVSYTFKDVKGDNLNFQFITYIENHLHTISKTLSLQKITPINYKIETSTFRDKLVPGEEEIWSFKIKNQKDQPMVAEVLASMYDLGLDQFKPSYWGLPYFNNYNYGIHVGYFENIEPLNDDSDSIFFNSTYDNTVTTLEYDRLRFFGLNFNNPGIVNSSYLKNISRKHKELKPKQGFVVGVVSDYDGPLVGATVNVKGTNIATTTDFDGRYEIVAQKEDVLVVSYVGYESKEIMVGEDTVINASLNSSLDEVVVVGYRTTKKPKLTSSVSIVTSDSIEMLPSSSVIQRLQGQVPGLQVQYSSGQPGANSLIQLRGVGNVSGNTNPLIILDGVPISEADFKRLNQGDIKEIATLKDAAATSIYGNRGANGVIVISTKQGVSTADIVNQEIELNKVKARKNLKETAFFLPHLKTDKQGNLKVSFTSPEMLTEWKFRLLAHNKQGQFAQLTKTVRTQKDLSIVPNAPRFLREKDTIKLSTKIANLSEEDYNGIARLQLSSAIDGSSIDDKFNNTSATQNFQVDAGGNTSVAWTFVVPVGAPPVTYRITASTGKFSDGEENVLPVLTNRDLVTETQSMWVRSGVNKSFTLNNLKENNSSTLEHHKLTLEYTSNPAWYAIKALPYLKEYEHECAEQTFSRYFANATSAHILNSHPEVKKVFDKWAALDVPLSKLEKNDQLKSILLTHTPWVLDTQDEKEQLKRLATLFDLDRTAREQKRTFKKLKKLQNNSGWFPWFNGGADNEYISRHIVSGIGRMEQLQIRHENQEEMRAMYDKGVHALDKKWEKQFKNHRTNYGRITDTTKFKSPEDYNFYYGYWHYQYARSFGMSQKRLKPVTGILKEYEDYAFAKAKTEFATHTRYQQLLIALVLHRNGFTNDAQRILEGLKQIAINSEARGMYWENTKYGWRWYNNDVNTVALAIEAFAEITDDQETVESLKVSLIRRGRANRWDSTKSTAMACYALLLKGDNFTSISAEPRIYWAGKDVINQMLNEDQVEEGTGYFKTSIDKEKISKDYATVTVDNKSSTTGYGALYWQYFEDLDKIKAHSGDGPLKVKKQLFKNITKDDGTSLQEITQENPVKIGDLITVRIIITAVEDMEYIHLKDMRSSGFEPVDVISKYKWQDGLGYYQSTKDVASHFFFDKIGKGTYVFDYNVRANNAGQFSNGITRIESMYAPEYGSHSSGTRVNIVE
ncbi:MG2 domain-containing protein [Nonlabens sp. SY33080]|uniref:alpha-2-macroglobulin family protein n=1 Tax=Nonlabens sp. SY33080 TaxID=2719911 RepID=UPI001428ADF3|nr:MG2 domain-containing protein [Nonlabens sp. SY33080]